MRHHAMRFGWVTALAFGLADAGLAETLTAALNFGSTTQNLTGSDGYYWQAFRSTSTVIANLTATDGTSPTGLRFECLNPAGFENGGRQWGGTWPGGLHRGH